MWTWACAAPSRTWGQRWRMLSECVTQRAGLALPARLGWLSGLQMRAKAVAQETADGAGEGVRLFEVGEVAGVGDQLELGVRDALEERAGLGNGRDGVLLANDH